MVPLVSSYMPTPPPPQITVQQQQQKQKSPNSATFADITVTIRVALNMTFLKPIQINYDVADGLSMCDFLLVFISNVYLNCSTFGDIYAFSDIYSKGFIYEWS